ncbi:unnamed protein product [Gadus morhua 'NCC']
MHHMLNVAVPLYTTLEAMLSSALYQPHPQGGASLHHPRGHAKLLLPTNPTLRAGPLYTNLEAMLSSALYQPHPQGGASLHHPRGHAKLRPLPTPPSGRGLSTPP